MLLRQLTRLTQFNRTLFSCTNNFGLAQTENVTSLSSNFRTDESNTSNHSDLHDGKFYTIATDEKKIIYTGGGLPRLFEIQCKTFAETCVMVRSPALEIMGNMRRTDFTQPVTRYVVYGDNGVGKSLTLAHVIHYGYQNSFLLVHVPWVSNWMKRPKETSSSTSQDNMYDLPFDAAAWLVHFKTQNAELLSKLNLKTSEDFIWSKREKTPSGSSLSELVDHGIARLKFATETIIALLKEIKQHATNGRCKVLVAMDGFNAFYNPETRIFVENKQRLTPDRITLTQPFLDICKFDWSNGVCVLVVDKIASTEGYMESYLPRYLLGKNGFEHLDPFIPVCVKNYNDKEYENCINYYLDRSWIQKHPSGFEEQLRYLSNQNPYLLMQLARSL